MFSLRFPLPRTWPFLEIKEIAGPKGILAGHAGDLGIYMDTVLMSQHFPIGLLSREEVIFMNGQKHPKLPLQQT